MDNIILRCDNNINGIFSAIYDAFVYKNQIQKENHEVYRDNISIEIGIGGNYTLFSKMIDIETRVSQNPDFQRIAFFHHLIFEKR